MADPALDALLDPSFIDGLDSLLIEELRKRRSRAAEVEVGLSYARRLVQGRLDIVMAEARRRETGAAATDLSELVDRLPEILGDRVRTPGTGRLPTFMAPGEDDGDQASRIDEIVEPAQLVDLPRLDTAALLAILDGLNTLEREVSSERRALHKVMECLQQELIRRYKSGEASVDSLLQ